MAQHLLEGHPPWRQLTIVAVVLPVVVVGLVLAFAWPAGRTAPRDVPLGVVGTSPAGQHLVERLDAGQPGAFDFRLYPDTDTARSAIEHRDVYGAFAVTPGHLTVLQASAASPTVAQLLTTTGAKIGAASGLTVSDDDVVALSADDPRGSVFSSALLPLTICGLLLAAAVGIFVRFRPAWRQLRALAVVSAVVAAGVYLVAQTFLGALPHQGALDWGAIALTVLAISTSTAGLVALVGAGGLGVAGVLMVFLGNAFSGATSAPEMLPDGVRNVGQWLPTGAGANLLRSTAYFDGHGAAGHLAVLLVWIVVGAAAVVVGHHAPIRFAAQRGATDRPAEASVRRLNDATGREPAAREAARHAEPASA